MVISRRALHASLIAASLVFAACGNDKTEPPNVTTPGKSLGAVPTTIPSQGIAFDAPGGWNVDLGEEPLVASVATGQATVAVWRYPRTEKLPKSKLELTAAKEALLKAAKQRDPTFTEIKSAATTIADLPAVQIRARETIAGQPRVVRSTHIYAFGAEIVIDAYASADVFRRVDADAFRSLLRSLKITAPKAG